MASCKSVNVNCSNNLEPEYVHITCYTWLIKICCPVYFQSLGVGIYKELSFPFLKILNSEHTQKEIVVVITGHNSIVGYILILLEKMLTGKFR